ncbi:tRNA-dihydrouridine synthase C [Eubacteriaceae bacterium CHKCI005]|nr:tRNA-dihydrouridine synthase C [Eubacteriaceae bacterium CHKCI005]
MHIGSYQIEGRAVLAPMAGVADRAFRELCAGYGAAMTTSEMVSSKGLVYGDRKSAQLLQYGEEERPIALQIFGDDPAIMAQATSMVMEYRPDIIDINMGCPAPKIVNNGCGSALMRNPDLCGRLVEAVVGAADVPVTVKIRKGWDAQSVNAVEVAKVCEQAGVAAITVHGRTRDQMYAPTADWDIIKAVKQAVSVPVIGNGDVFRPEDAARLLEETGCDAVMVGRGALGTPWIFREINAWLDHHCMLPLPGIKERMFVMLKHIKRMCELKGERGGMLEARKHAAWYMKGLRGAPGFRAQAGALSTFADAERLAMAVLSQGEPGANPS